MQIYPLCCTKVWFSYFLSCNHLLSVFLFMYTGSVSSCYSPMDIDLPYNIDMNKGKKKKVVQGNNKEAERKDKQKGM